MYYLEQLLYIERKEVQMSEIVKDLDKEIKLLNLRSLALSHILKAPTKQDSILDLFENIKQNNEKNTFKNLLNFQASSDKPSLFMELCDIPELPLAIIKLCIENKANINLQVENQAADVISKEPNFKKSAFAVSLLHNRFDIAKTLLKNNYKLTNNDRVIIKNCFTNIASFETLINKQFNHKTSGKCKEIDQYLFNIKKYTPSNS